MLVSKVSTGLFRNALLKAENIASLGIIVNPQNPHTKEVCVINKRFKHFNEISCEEKKRCGDPPEKPRTLLKIAAVAVIGTTVAVIAAKHDDELRDWVKEHLPTLDELVKIVYQEEETLLESLDRAHKNLTAWIKKVLHDLFDQSQKSKPISSKSSGSETMSSLPPLEKCDDDSIIKKPYKPPESAFEDESKKETLADKEHKLLKEIEEGFHTAAKEVIHTVIKTECYIKDHAKLINHLEHIISTDNRVGWSKLKKLKTDADKGLEKIKNTHVNFKGLEKQLDSKLKESENLEKNIKDKAQQNLKTVAKDVKDALAKLEKTVENSKIVKSSWDKVKQARLHFSEELEHLFPNIWLNDEKLNIPADQTHPFTEKVLNDIDSLNRHSKKTAAIYDTHINAAAEKYKNNKDPKALDEVANALVPHEIAKEKRKMQSELSKNMLAHKAKCDKNAKELSKQTKEVYKDLTDEALRIKEKEVERKMQQQYEEKLAAAKNEYKEKVAKMVARMQGANEAIAKRGEKDVNEQKKQQFWSAAQSFMAAVKPLGGAPTESKPLKNEIANLNKVKPENDELVEGVLNSIPPEAAEKGIPTEAELREKFNKAMGCARGWAGVPAGEITLLQLLLARVQGALYMPLSIPKAEMNNEPAIDPEKLNNYDIMYRAQYYVDRGDFDQAIRYLNLLKGPAGKVVQDWAKDARVYLETRQAAEVLLAYATAAGM